MPFLNDRVYVTDFFSFPVRGWLAHNEYINLSAKEQGRQHAYRELFKDQLSEIDLHLIRKAAHYCQPVGDERFKVLIEEKYGIKLGQSKPGRPRRKVMESG